LFILCEHPEDGAPARDLQSMLKFAGDDEGEIAFGSVGELYRLIESGFRTIDEEKLFIGSPKQQMTLDLIHFRDIVSVTDRESAIRSIEEITEQGEGTARDRNDSRFGAFVTMLNEWMGSKAQGSGFSPVRPAMNNPTAFQEPGYGAKGNPINDPLESQVAALFDSVYSLMLRMLAWSFQFDAAGREDQLRSACAVAIDLMPRVLLPMGEGLMLMPAGPKYPGKTAGPGFGLTRQVQLPSCAANASLLCRERFQELAAIAKRLAKHQQSNPAKAGCLHLQEIADGSDTRVKL
jgi:Ferritin-like